MCWRSSFIFTVTTCLEFRRGILTAVRDYIKTQGSVREKSRRENWPITLLLVAYFQPYAYLIAWYDCHSTWAGVPRIVEEFQCLGSDQPVFHCMELNEEFSVHALPFYETYVTVLMLSVVYHICVRWQVWCFSCKVCVPVFIHSAFSDMCMFSIRMCTLRQRCLLNWHSSVFVIHVFVNKTNVCTCELIQTDFVFENSRWLQRQKLDKILHRNAKDSFMRMSKHWKNV